MTDKPLIPAVREALLWFSEIAIADDGKSGDHEIVQRGVCMGDCRKAEAALARLDALDAEELAREIGRANDGAS